MIVAVDTSALLAVFKSERNGPNWFEFLFHLRSENHLIACDVVWAEVAPLFQTLAALRRGMDRMGVLFSPIEQEAAFLAGRLFTSYRSRGGRRERMVPDFLVAAHALQQANALATADDDFAARHFSELTLLRP